jgi:hypothetical protein
MAAAGLVLAAPKVIFDLAPKSFRSRGNPLFKGALARWDGVVIYEHPPYEFYDGPLWTSRDYGKMEMFPLRLNFTGAT